MPPRAAARACIDPGSIDPGSALMGLAEDAIEAYGLDLDPISSSGPGMMSALERAYEREEPVVLNGASFERCVRGGA